MGFRPRGKDEIVRKVYDAQKADTCAGDFFELVTEDKDSINLNISETEMTNMKKEKLKIIVKNKIRQAAFQYLKNLQNTHSKMSGINYSKFELSSYMKSPLFNSESVKLLLALRTRTVEGIRSDFKGLFPDTSCPLGCGKPDTLQNILACSVLTSLHTSVNPAFSSGGGDVRV